MKKTCSVIGIIVGIVIIVMGLYLAFGVEYDLRGYYSGTSTFSYTFGADYYTEQYAATQHAADNVNALGSYMNTAMRSQVEVFGDFAMIFGIIIALMGGAVTCYFGYKLDEVKNPIVPANPVVIRQETTKQVSDELPEL